MPALYAGDKEPNAMKKILVLYYSMYGHIETLAQSVVDGANSADDVEVTLKHVPETMTAEALENASRPFAEARMDSRIRQALAGQNVDEVN